MNKTLLKPVALAVVVALSFVLWSVPAVRAGTFTNLYVFGDSLSDVGNVYVATGGSQPASPYYDGRYSNGPVWVEYLAADLGLPRLQPSLLGGTDFAWAGAETGTGLSVNSTPNVGTQVSAYLGQVSNQADPGGLYVVWAGANDIFDFGSSENVATSAQNVQTAVQELYAAAPGSSSSRTCRLWTRRPMASAAGRWPPRWLRSPRGSIAIWPRTWPSCRAKMRASRSTI